MRNLWGCLTMAALVAWSRGGSAQDAAPPADTSSPETPSDASTPAAPAEEASQEPAPPPGPEPALGTETSSPQPPAPSDSPAQSSSTTAPEDRVHTDAARQAASAPNATSSESTSASPRHVERGYTALWYDLSMPVGGTYDYAGNFSGRGMSLEYRHLLTPHVSVGLLGAWHVISDKRHETEERGPLTVTATELRTINVVPIQVTGHYYFTRFGSRPTPYAGAGMGIHWAERRTAIPGWGFRQDAWHFGLSPEVGLLIPIGINQIALGARFNYLFSSGDKPDEAYFGFKVGLAEL